MLYIYPVLACQSGQNCSYPPFARQRMCILNSWNRPLREHGALRMGNERRGCSDLPSEFGVRGVTRGSETRRWVWAGTSGSHEPPSPSWAGHRSLPGDKGRPEIMRCDGMTRKRFTAQCTPVLRHVTRWPYHRRRVGRCGLNYCTPGFVSRY
jgi:hypothetical protein